MCPKVIKNTLNTKPDAKYNAFNHMYIIQMQILNSLLLWRQYFDHSIIWFQLGLLPAKKHYFARPQIPT